ncbi:polyamine aminopropyltransferase [Pyrofollis japonicus]|uniref:polyamine aminopropyltransferase n=1 Tax=Pyrofollis japonicus TaxID=3060460 RepID=UPI00295AA1BC|nr:polyamine aminopropyltransferase [Pyrofollis japonicus]BEP18201.1 polyamine aminopropyltransferase [Pyrofollis japonicus]
MHQLKDVLLLYQYSGPLSTIYYIEDIIYKTKSKYQEIIIAKLKEFGKSLILDGLIQSTEYDEYIYHEALVHPSMILHPSPEHVLVLGGGEGATLREVLRHNTVQRAVMVDIDKEVIEVSKKYLPEWHQGAFEDRRSEIVVMDGFKYVEEAASKGEKFDVIIMDLTDPYGSEIAAHLYNVDAFKLLSKVLSNDGVLVTQAGCSSLFPKEFKQVYESAKKVFKYVYEYVAWVPSFAYMNSFIIASNRFDALGISPNTVEKRIKDRELKTRYFNSRRYFAMFWLAS